MRRSLHAIILFAVASLILPAQAGIFKKPQPPSNAGERIGELFGILKTDKDDRKRVTAAAELRNFDAHAHPEIISILADVVQSDKHSGVRLEAVQSLAKIRPATHIAAQALEQAGKDSNVRVRLHARAVLLGYRLSISDKAPEAMGPIVIETKKEGLPQEASVVTVPEPPAKQPSAKAAPKTGGMQMWQFFTQPFTKATAPKTAAPKTATAPKTTTAPPPLAMPSIQESGPIVPRPMPSNPSFSTAVPTPLPRVTPTPIIPAVPPVP